MANPVLKTILVIVGLTLLFSTILISNVNMVHSQSSSKRPTIHGVKIHTPRLGDKVPINIDNFTITGRSVDNQSSDCRVLVIVNDVRPYQQASASGLDGRNDFSQWKYKLSNDYAKLKFGTNKITAKVECKNPLDMLRYDTVTIMGTKAFDSKQHGISQAKDISRSENNESLEADNLLIKRSAGSEDLENTIINGKNLTHPLPNTSLSRLESLSTDAQNIYSDKKMIIPSSVKYFLILIPNEGHESTNQPKNQLPLINQPYVPQNTIIDKSTSILWLNADVGHKHKISLNNSNSEKIFENTFFKYNTTSKTIVLNETGTYQYWESNVSKEVPDFVMTGTITVTSQKQRNATAESQDKEDILGTFMVPARYLDKYRSEFEDNGFTVYSTYTYKDLRGGQKGTGPEQSLIVWKAHNVPLKKVVSDLEEITPNLPYN